MTALLLAWAMLATFAAAVLTIGGVRIVRYADRMKQERDEARYAAAEQAEDIQAKHDTIQRACTIMRQLLEALPEDEKWQDVEDYVTENAADEWASATGPATPVE